MSASAAAEGFRNEPGGFRGLSWGAALDLRFSARRDGPHGPFHVLRNDSLSFGDLVAYDIEYTFHEGGLQGAFVDIRQQCDDWQAMVQHKYGPPTYRAGDDGVLVYLLWEGTESIVRFVHKTKQQRCSLVIRSTEFANYLASLDEKYAPPDFTEMQRDRLLEEAAESF